MINDSVWSHFKKHVYGGLSETYNKKVTLCFYQIFMASKKDRQALDGELIDINILENRQSILYNNQINCRERGKKQQNLRRAIEIFAELFYF